MKIDVSAPGGDNRDKSEMRIFDNILSLRAQGTDMYGGGTHIVGRFYYRARGTSMAAPHVSGLAGLILAFRPGLSNEQVRQAIRVSADDLDTPNFDINTGYGRINANNALGIEQIPNVEIAAPFNYSFIKNRIDISGTAAGDGFSFYELEYSPGLGSDSDLQWTLLFRSETPVLRDILAQWNTSSLDDGVYTLRLKVINSLARQFEDRVVVYLANEFQQGWPISLFPASFSFGGLNSADLDGDGNLEVVARVKEAGETTIYVWRYDGVPLSGWPIRIPRSGGGHGVVSIGDITGDSGLELVAILAEWVYAWRADGSLVPGFPIRNRYFIDSLPLLINLDDNPDLEIVATDLHGYKVHAWQGNGAPVSGWPVSIPSFFVVPSLAGGDVDKDGENEIVIVVETKELYLPLRHQYILIFDRRGRLKYPLIPLRREAGDTNVTSPSLGDIDGDGDLEIFVYSEMDQALFAYHHEGSPVSGWPVSTDHPDYHMNTDTAPVLADLDQDGQPEIILAFRNSRRGEEGEKKKIYEGKIYIWNSSGELLEGWPKTINNYLLPPIAVDIDGDRDLEIIG